MFARHSWYFRNALVRANYKNSMLGIDYDFQYLERFFSNLLLGQQHELKNCYLIIDAPDNWNITQEKKEKLGNDFDEIVEKLGKRAERLGKKLGKTE